MRFARDSPRVFISVLPFLRKPARRNRPGMIFSPWNCETRHTDRWHPINSTVRTDNRQICKQCCKANKLIRSHRAFLGRNLSVLRENYPNWSFSFLTRWIRMHRGRQKKVSRVFFFAFTSRYLAWTPAIDVANNDKINIPCVSTKTYAAWAITRLPVDFPGASRLPVFAGSLHCNWVLACANESPFGRKTLRVWLIIWTTTSHVLSRTAVRKEQW